MEHIIRTIELPIRERIKIFYEVWNYLKTHPEYDPKSDPIKQKLDQNFRVHTYLALDMQITKTELSQWLVSCLTEKSIDFWNKDHQDQIELPTEYLEKINQKIEKIKQTTGSKFVSLEP